MKIADIYRLPRTAVFLAKIAGETHHIMIEHVRYETNDKGRHVAYAYGYIVECNATDDYAVRRTAAMRVTMPYITNVAFESAIDMRSNIMAIDARRHYIASNY